MSDNFWNCCGGFAALLTVALMIFKVAGEDIQWLTCLAPIAVYMACTVIMVCTLTIAGYFYSKLKGGKGGKGDDDRAGS